MEEDPHKQAVRIKRGDNAHPTIAITLGSAQVAHNRPHPLSLKLNRLDKFIVEDFARSAIANGTIRMGNHAAYPVASSDWVHAAHGASAVRSTLRL